MSASSTCLYSLMSGYKFVIKLHNGNWNAPSRRRTGCYLFTVSNSGLLSVQCQPVTDTLQSPSPIHSSTHLGLHSSTYSTYQPACRWVLTLILCHQVAKVSGKTMLWSNNMIPSCFLIIKISPAKKCSAQHWARTPFDRKPCRTSGQAQELFCSRL